MELVSVPSVRASIFVFQPRNGVFALTVVCKLTFALLPGVCTLSPEPDEIRELESHWDDDPGRSLHAPSDVAPFKRRADILLVGSAHAPGGRAVRTLTARLSAAGMEKAVAVFGPRLFTPTGELREGSSWTKMPLRYERAAGGPDTWNPVGVWLDGPRDPYGQRHLPNLQPDGVELRERGQLIAPVGFGPIASGWPLRVERLRGRTDIANPLAARNVPIGDDFDAGYFQDAPPDQQVSALRADESIVLENLHPEGERFVTRLPGLRPRAVLEIGTHAEEVELDADTLWLDTDRGRCTLTFRGQIALLDPAAKGRVRITLDESQAVRPARASVRPPPASPPVPATAAASSSEKPVSGGETGNLSQALSPDDLFPRESTTDEILPDLGTASWRVATEGVKDTTAIQPPLPATASLPFSAQSPPAANATKSVVPAAPAPPPAPGPPRVKTLPAGTVRTAAARAEGRQMTQEIVMPASALAGPAWLAPSVEKPPVERLAPERLAPERLAPERLAPERPASESPVAPAGPVFRQPPPPPEIVKLGEVDTRALSSAATVGVLAASNAAAGAPKKEAGRAPAAELAEAKAEGKAESSYLELLSFERAIVPRLRSHDVFSAWMRPVPKAPPTQQGKPPPPPPTPEAVEKAERESVYSILTKDPQATAEPKAQVDGTSAKKGQESDQDSEPPLVLVQGTLAFAFDPLDVLKTALALTKPLSSADKKLKEAVDLAAELLGSGLETDEGAEAITARIREAWGRSGRPHQTGQLDARIEQKLLEQRRYQKRTVLDAEWIRALLLPPSGEGVVVYLPVKLEKRLPLFARFPVKLLAELYPQQDPQERSLSALKAVALARVTARPKLA